LRIPAEALENLALRQQLAMLKLSVKRPRVSATDRLFWVLFSRYVDAWRAMLHTLHPDTVVRWHRENFRRYWWWKSRRRAVGRPPIDREIRELILEMQSANVGRGRLQHRGKSTFPPRHNRGTNMATVQVAVEASAGTSPRAKRGPKTVRQFVDLHSADISRTLGPYQSAQPITE